MRNILILSISILLFSCSSDRKLKKAYINYDEKLCLFENGKYLYAAGSDFSYGTYKESNDSLLLRSHYQAYPNGIEIEEIHVNQQGTILIKDKKSLVPQANIYINNIKYSHPNTPSSLFFINDTLHVKTIQLEDMLNRKVSQVIDVKCDTCNSFNIYIDGYLYNNTYGHYIVFDDILYLKSGDSLHVSSSDLNRLTKDNGGSLVILFQKMKYSNSYQFKDVGLWCRDIYKQHLADLKKKEKK